MSMGMDQKRAKKGDNQYSGKCEGPMGGSAVGGSRIGKAFTKKEPYKGKKDSGYMP